MRHEAEFERWLAAWIDTGPSEAPDRTIERAIAYAGTHRQRRLTRSAVWRGVMDRMHLTPVSAPSARSGWLMAAAVVAAVILVAAAVIGSGTIRFGGTDKPLPAVGGPSATPTVAPSPVSVTGSESCTQTSTGTTAIVYDVTDYRGITMSCTDTASDPRVGGTSALVVSIDKRSDGSADIWGTLSLSNTSGAWVGRWSGTVDKGYTTHRIESLATGSGAYSGLVYRFRLTGDGTTFTLTGRIEPLGTTVQGTESCTVTDGGLPGVNAGDVGALRGYVFTCTDVMSDSRLSGTATYAAAKDQRADGSGDTWGSYVLRNANGSWEGRWSGTSENADTIDGILTGTGAYAGLEYWIHGEGAAGDPSGGTLTGTIVPAL